MRHALAEFTKLLLHRIKPGLQPIDPLIHPRFQRLDGPIQAIRDTSPQALHHYTRFDQVNQLVGPGITVLAGNG